METIASFEVDHTVLNPGIYLSRVDHGVATYDIRVTQPNREFLPNPAMHTIEHLFAVSARNGALGDKIIYFGPMGCRTGFYLLMIHNTHTEAVELIRKTFSYIASYEGPVPGTAEKECGNSKSTTWQGQKKLPPVIAKLSRIGTIGRSFIDKSVNLIVRFEEFSFSFPKRGEFLLLFVRYYYIIIWLDV